MKQKALILAALLAVMIVPAAAQGIYEAQLATKSSIVRVWQERDVVIYNKEPSGQNGFLLYTVGSTSAQYIDLPDSIIVKDFEIRDDEVWFCGECSSVIAATGRTGVVGTFSIPNAFTGTTGIDFAVMNTYVGQEGYDVFVHGLERLDLFTDGNNMVMAMTGDGYIYHSANMTRSTVVSAIFYSGTSLWRIHALLDVDSTAVYTDIAALDNVVTAVGTRENGLRLIAKTFIKNTGFPNWPMATGLGDSIACLSSIGKALITHLSDDEAAVVQFDEKGRTMLHMLDFSTGSAVPIAPTRVTNDPNYPYDSEWNLNEIRYSPLTDNISVLEYGVLPSGSPFETLLWTFPRTAWHPTLVPVQPMTLVRQASMDVDIDSHPVTVGELLGSGNLDVQSYAAYSGYDSPPMAPLLDRDDCIDYEEIKYLEEYPTVPRVFVNDNGPNDLFNNQEHQPKVSEIIFTQNCGKE